MARVAVGKPPSAIGLVARTLAPPVVADDQALYARRALSMTWTRGRRELAISGRLPLEQGAVFEQAIWDIAKTQRAADKQTDSVPDWQQSAADALVTLAQSGGGDRGGVRRSATTLIVHLTTTSRRSSRAPGHSAARPPNGSPATRAASNCADATWCTRVSGGVRRTRSCARCTSAHAIVSTPAAPQRASSKRTTSSPTSTTAGPSSST